MTPSRQATARAILMAALLLLSLWVLWHFLPALAWAGVIAIATWPLRQRLCGRMGPDAAAAVLTLAVALVLLVPLLLFGVELAREAGHIGAFIQAIREHGAAMPDWLPRIPALGPYAASWWQQHLGDPDAAKELLGPSGPLGFAHWSRNLGSELVRRIVILGFTLLALFFAYRDGPQALAQGGRIADRMFGPQARRFGHDSVAAVRATVNGLVLVGLAEGLIMGFAYALAGVTHPVLLGLATGILAIIPFGAPAVLAVAGLILLAQGQIVSAVLLVAFGAAVVAVADHIVRPVIIGSAIRLPFLWTLIGVFGGLEAFGIIGLFLGPAIMSIAMAIWRDAAAEGDAALATAASAPPSRLRSP